MINHETQTPNIAEVSAYSSEQVSKAFTKSVDIIPRITADPNFHALCLGNGLDPIEDCERPGYWRLFGSYITQKISKGREEHDTNLQQDALELIASAPAFMWSNLLVTKDHPSLGKNPRLKDYVIGYNHQIEDFVRKYPETSPSALKLAMRNTFVKATGGESIRLVQAADQQLEFVITGLQHEIAFGQILEATGRQYRPATAEEDRKGFDYKVDNHSFKPLRIDVKSKLRKISDGEDTNIPYRIRGAGHISMLSLIRPDDFHDRFFISPDLAAEKAPYLNSTIDEVKKIAV